MWRSRSYSVIYRHENKLDVAMLLNCLFWLSENVILVLNCDKHPYLLASNSNVSLSDH